MNNVYKQYGFTLLELLLVVAIIAILASAIAPVSSRLFSSAQLNENAASIVQTLRTARQRSVARFNDTTHGVYFEINEGADRFILYQGTSYATRNSAYDRIEILDDSITMTTNISGNEVTFFEGNGTPSATGTITLNHQVYGSESVSVDARGKIEEN